MTMSNPPIVFGRGNTVKKRSQFGKLFAICFLACLVVASTLMPAQGEARTEIQKLEREVQRLQERMEQAKRNSQQAETRIEQIREEREEVIQDIQVLNAKIADSVQRLQQIEGQIHEQEQELELIEQSLTETIQRIHDRDKLLRSRLHLMYTNGTVSYLEVLLQSTSFADFIERYNVLKSLVSQDKEILESNERDKQLFEANKEEAERLLALLEENYMEAESLRRSLMEQRKEREVKIASLNAEESHQEYILEEEERALMEAASRIEEAQREIEELEAYYKGGKLGYPLPRTYRVTSHFGYRTDPITGRSGAFHNGTDFGAPGGTNVLAAESGKVLVAEWYGGYGNTVIINHGNGLWTLYAHMQNNSITVKEGDIVQKGDVIGKVGTTGRSTGNHLHFEVRLNGQVVDPREYLNL